MVLEIKLVFNLIFNLKNKNMSDLINKILESENIFDADFFFCDSKKIGNFDFQYHTEKKISNSQVYCVTFTYNDNNYEVAIDNNFIDNLVNILNQLQY